MTPKREYSILPQAEGSDFHHHVREGKTTVSSQYICLFTAVTVVIFLILAGVATLTASIFYSEQVSTTFGHLWYSYESTSSNGTSTSTSRTTSDDSSSLKEGSSFSVHGSRNHTASVSHHNPADYDDQHNKTLEDSNRQHHHHHQHHIHHGKNGSSSSSDNYLSGDDSGSGTRYSTNNTSGENDISSESGEQSTNSTMEDTSGKEQDIVNVEELKQKFAEAMRDFEKHMENITGIRKAEFVVPIFMLTCFLTLFSFISVCCCIMMRRRDNRRRKLFGKLITDLQTGDSKTVLLNHSDLDD